MNSEPSRGGKEAKHSAPSGASEGEAATPLELAALAVLIDPAAFRVGNGRDALFQAMSAFLESAALCDEMAKMTYEQQRAMLLGESSAGSKGAKRLIETLLRLTTPPESFLTLAVRDDEDDTLRPYLENHCNLEGKKHRKSWSRVRTVMNNLRYWLVFAANEDNRKNAGSTQNEEWEDAERVCDQFFRRYGVGPFGKNAEPGGYRFPQEVVDRFIAWKKWIRTQKGGMTAVRPLTREEIFQKPIKKKNPTRRR